MKDKTHSILRALLAMAFILWLADLSFVYLVTDESPDLELNEPDTMAQVMLKAVSLPAVPVATNQTSNVLAPQQAKQNTAQTAAEPTTTETIRTEQTTSAVAATEQVTQLYKQLSQQGLDIQLAWPVNSQQRKSVFEYMYQCAKMQFAVLDGINITKMNNTLHSPYSDWIRVAQGQLADKEKNWLQGFALQGIPIRLFPQALDWSMAKHLVQALNSRQLTSLRANYQVINQQLWLTEIRLNKRLLTQAWPLDQPGC
jgi:hypothetical protein